MDKTSRNDSDGGKGSQVIDSIYRVYTVTIKPVYKPFKGDHKRLLTTLLSWNKLVKCNSFKFVYESEGTDNLHLHALVECPLIKTLPYIFGYHIHKKIVNKQFNNEEDIKRIWHLYVGKEMTSCSERYHHMYGNMFED